MRLFCIMFFLLSICVCDAVDCGLLGDPTINDLVRTESEVASKAYDQLARNRKETVCHLIEIVRAQAKIQKERPRFGNPGLLAINLLGEMRAIEAVDVFFDNLFVFHDEIHGEPRLDALPAAGEALVRIGKPASTKALELLKDSVDPSARVVFVLIIGRVEGRDVARFMIERALNNEPNQEYKKRYESALKVLDEHPAFFEP